MPDNPVAIIESAPEWGDPWRFPRYYSAITAKRIIAYLIDIVAVMAMAWAVWFATFILGVLSLGLLMPVHVVLVTLVPLAYHTFFISGERSATPGMRAMGIKVLSLAPGAQSAGGRPTLLQSFIQTVAFYGSITMTGSLILLVALFNPRRRTLHDWLAGTVVVNAPA